MLNKSVKANGKRIARVLILTGLMCVSAYGQNKISTFSKSKYGAKGAPEVRIPQTWYSGNNTKPSDNGENNSRGYDALEYAQEWVDEFSIDYGQSSFDLVTEFSLVYDGDDVSGGLGGDDPENCQINWPEDPYKMAVYSFVSEYVLEEGASVGCFIDNDLLDHTYAGVAETMEIGWSGDEDYEDFTLVIFDSWGDGWDGAYMDVSVNGELVLDGIAFDEYCDDYYYYYYDECSYASFSLAVNDGDLVETVYTAGDDEEIEEEHSYAFYDQLGNLVASDGPSPGTGISFTVSISSDIPGCTDAYACNYNPNATEDDGSCCLTNCTTIAVGGDYYMSEISWEILDLNGDPVVSGGGTTSSEFVCFDDGDYTVNGYDSYGDGWGNGALTVTDNDGNIVVDFTVSFGDGDFGTTTFSLPYTDQGISGCMTAEACNYNPDATVDDGSCCLTNCTTIEVDGGTWQSEITWEILDADGQTVVFGIAPDSVFACFDDGDYTVNGYDSYGDGWNGNILTVTDDNGIVLVEFFVTGDEGTTTFSVPYIMPLEQVLISEICDFANVDLGPLSFIEIYNPTDTDIDLGVADVDTNLYIAGYADGSTDGYSIPLSGTIAAGDVFVVAKTSFPSPDNQEAFVEIFGFEADQYSETMTGDGNDAFALSTSGYPQDPTPNVFDILGEIGVDGTGTAWEYTDQTIMRNEGSGPNPVWDAAEWTFGAGDGTFATPGWHINPPCADNSLTMYMHDSYGDSWNGNIYVFVDANGEIVASGGIFDYVFEGADDLCLADGVYNLSVGGGTWQAEVSWELVDNVTGEILAEGGAPYNQNVAINFDAVWGCMDPDAVNYDESANAGDGSCFYAGDSCFIALTAVIGSNDDDGANSWYEYTATIDGYAVVSSDIDEQYIDTRLAIFSDCEGADWSGSVPDGNYITYNDNAWDEAEYYDYASIVEFPITAGTTYMIYWDDANDYYYYYGSSPFTWTLEESEPDTGPTDLVADPGMGEVMLTWDPFLHGAGSLIQQQATNILDADDLAQAFADKKAQYQEEMPIIVGNTLEELLDRYHRSSSRDASVYFVITDSYGDGYWGDGYITDADGNTVFYAPGGNWGDEIAYGPILFGTGDYTVSFDAAGSMVETTWQIYTISSNGIVNVLVNGDVYTPVVFNISDGGNVSLADLSVSIEYNEFDDNVYFHMENTGSMPATGFSLNIYIGAADGECDNPNDYSAIHSFSTEIIGGVPAGETVSVFLPDLGSTLGGTDHPYGTFTVGAFVDAFCIIDESDETNNTVTEDITFVDPLAGLVWNIYRQSGTDLFTQIALTEYDEHSEPEYLDEDVIGDVEYCYYVTQITGDGGTESDTSNHDCAIPAILVDLPVPQGLSAEALGSEVFLEWTAPYLEGGDEMMAVSDFEDSTWTDFMEVEEWQIGNSDVASSDWFVIPEHTLFAFVNDDANGSGADPTEAYIVSESIDISIYDIDDLAIAMDIYFPQNDGDCSEGQIYSEEARLNILLDDTEVEIPIYGYTDEWDNPVESWFTRQFELADLFDDIDDINLDDTPGNTLQFAIEYSDCGGNWGYGIAVDNIVLRTPTDFNLLGYYIYRNDEFVLSTTDTSDIDWVWDLGEYSYYVTALYDDYEYESDPSETVMVTVVDNTVEIDLGITESIGMSGDTVTVSVWADLSAYTMDFYEIWIYGFSANSIASFVSADTVGSMLPSGWTFDYNHEYFGYDINVTADAGEEGEGVSGSGNLFNLSFVLNDNFNAPGGSVGLYFSSITINDGENLSYNSEPGSVSLLNYGDVSLDGSVTAFDASMILQSLVGMMELDDLQASVGDVTLDASLSALDAALVLQFIVGLIDNLPHISGIDLAAGGDVVIPNGSVSPGNVFQMPILLDDGSNILSFELEFSYDPDVLVYQSISWNESLTGLTILDSQDDGIIKVSAAGTEAVDPGSITLGWVEFEMVDTFDDYQTTVTLTRSRLNEEVVLVDGSAGVYTNSLLVVDEWGHGGVPEIFSLEQNFPNPFNPVTQIRYQLPEQSRVSISIYDIMGRAVRTLVSSDAQLAGYRQVVWDATNDLGEPVSAGMYLYVIQAGDFRDTRKMVLMK